jgi:dTDP-4-amino-4,6-dideoxygalactose transaminase
MVMSKFLPYASQSISQEDIEQVAQALSNEWITRGPLVEAFENGIANYCGAQFGVAFNSASTALIAAYFAGNIQAHDRLVTTPNTFASTVTAGMLHQAKPVFVDIDRTSGNLDLKLVEYNLNVPTSRGKTFLVPVHFSGIAVDMEEISLFNKNPDAVIIEDAAHALGSSYKDGQKVGSCAWSDMTVFSFHPAKNMTTGEGGMVLTNNQAYFERLKQYRNNQIVRNSTDPWYYEVQGPSSNFNFTEMQAALGLSQLKRLDAFVLKRRELVKKYRELLKDSEFTLFSDEPDERTAYHLFVVQIDFAKYKTSRTEVMNRLKEKGIGTQYHYIPLYRMPFITKNSEDLSGYFPQMEAYYAQGLSLPLYYDLTFENIEYIVKELKNCINT